MKLVIFFALVAVAFGAPQRLSLNKFLTTSRPQYGQYVVGNSGLNNGDDGQYRPDDSGAYNPDGSGAYVHSDNPYLQVGGAGGSYVNQIRYPVRPVGTISRPVTPVRPQGDSRQYAILRQIQDVGEDGYHYVYETENGIVAEEEGHLENKGTDNELMRVKGFYTYTGPDSVAYRVDYTVGEEGYVAAGAHLPVAPEIPEAIQRSLALQK